MIVNKLLIVFGLLGVIFFFTQFMVVSSTNDTEQPKYDVVESNEDFEIREYPDLILATTTIGTNRYSEGSSSGFRKVAGYIFGGNEDQQKIAMTSPVIMEMGDSLIEMSFIMPSEHDMENLPAPNDTAVRLHKQKGKKMAVVQFGGWASDDKIARKSALLKEALDARKIAYFDEVYYMGYNPPYQVVNRKNEIAIELK